MKADFACSLRAIRALLLRGTAALWCVDVVDVEAFGFGGVSFFAVRVAFVLPPVVLVLAPLVFVPVDVVRGWVPLAWLVASTGTPDSSQANKANPTANRPTRRCSIEPPCSCAKSDAPLCAAG